MTAINRTEFAVLWRRGQEARGAEGGCDGNDGFDESLIGENARSGFGVRYIQLAFFLQMTL